MMSIEEFEAKIKREIDPGLEIRKHPTNELSGVYYKGRYLGVALPRDNITDFRLDFYTDRYGVPFRGVIEAERDIKHKLKTMYKKEHWK